MLLGIRLALFEPDIPQNTGALIRLSACLGIGLDVIEPCGFPFSDRGLKRAGMDYVERAVVTAHPSWQAFNEALPGRRLLLLTTQAALPYTDFVFDPRDTLLLGRESAGVPPAVHQRADARLLIPMAPETRSLNVALAAAMVLGEALRQTAGFPLPDAHPPLPKKPKTGDEP